MCILYIYIYAHTPACIYVSIWVQHLHDIHITVYEQAASGICVCMWASEHEPNSVILFICVRTCASEHKPDNVCTRVVQEESAACLCVQNITVVAYIYINIYIYIYIYIYIFTHTFICADMYMYAYIYTHTYIYYILHTYAHTRAHNCVFCDMKTLACICIRIYIRTHTYIISCIHTHIPEPIIVSSLTWRHLRRQLERRAAH
jgi:hypothetical protein